MPFALGDAKGARSLRRIKELDGLRAILALWVVLVHCGKAVFPEAELPLGNILFDELTRVKVFFMISGMVVTGMLHDKRPAFPTYLANRILRLYPAFLAAILISAVMLPVAEYALALAPADAASNQSRVKLVDAAQRHFILHFVAHLTMLHGVIPTSLLNRAPYTIIGQAWNISTEFQFYLIAPMLLRLLAAWSFRKGPHVWDRAHCRHSGARQVLSEWGIYRPALGILCCWRSKLRFLSLGCSFYRPFPPSSNACARRRLDGRHSSNNL